MNALLLNRDGFQMPADGWYQVAPLGEFAHAQAGLTQVVDLDACKAMANRFAEEAKAPNFAGLLVDFDHFSLDGEKRSEAAGWITALEMRNAECGAGNGDVSRRGAEAQSGGGLFAKIRWSDVGEEAVKGGRYRFLSPVWNRADCVDLGGGRVRPVRLLNAAVTNDPNLKGMLPLSNRTPGGDGAAAPAGAAPVAEPRFKWVLGDTVGGAHCPSCTAMAGQSHTMPEWDAGGVKPGDDGLFCQGNCPCRLDPTDDPSDGPVMAGPVRKENADVTNRNGGVLANIGWTNEARAASLAVRQAKAAARGSAGTGGTGGGGHKGSVASILAKGYSHMTPAEVHQVAKALQAKAKTGADFTPDEQTFLQDSIDDPNAIPVTGTGGTDKAAKSGGKTKKRDPELGPTDYQTWFEEDGLKGMPQKAVDAYTDQLREKMAADDEPLTETETKFLGDLTDSGYEGLNNDDPITQWQTDRAKNEKRIRDATGMSSTDAASRVAAIETKMDGTAPVSPEEQALVDAYHKAKSMTNRFGGRNGDSALRARAQRDVAQARADLRNNRAARVEVDRDDAVLIGVLVNTGWTDQARVAALAVRQAKAGVRTQTVQTQGVAPAGVTPTRAADPGKQYVGGTPNFDESTGQYTYTQPVSQVPPGSSATPTVPRSPGKAMPPPYVPPVKPGAPVKPSPPVKVQPPVKVTPPIKGTPPVKGGPVPVNPPPYQFYRKPLQGSGGKTRAV